MPTLTGLAPDPRRAGYRLVEVDRGRFASIPADALEPLSLVVGLELPAPAFAFLGELADTEAAYRAALRALAARSRASGDLRRRLLQKQHPAKAADAALARLTEQGLLDDRRFALDYVARRAAKGRGAGRLIADLAAQGVERRVAETAVREAMEQEGIDSQQTLRAVASKRAAQLASLPRPTRRRRLLAYLARRGYAASEVRDLVEELLG